MLSLIGYVAKKIYGDNNEHGKRKKNGRSSKSRLNPNAEEIDDNSPIYPDPALAGLLLENDETDRPEAEEDEDGCVYAYGRVSLVHNSYVLIENRYMCETKYVVPADLKIGDRVKYMAYRTSKGEDLKVRKLIGKCDANWEQQQQLEAQDDDVTELDNGNDNNETEVSVEAPAPRPKPRVPRKLVGVGYKQLCKRVHVGKVVSRSSRNLNLEDGTSVDLGKVAADFVPVVGDWIQLDCLVKINDDVMNFKGKIVNIEAIKPHRTYNKVGIITEYNDELQYGMVNKSIVFNKLVCLNGYLPCVGDRVIVHSIESDQGVLKTRWRALNVVPLKDVSHKYDTSAVKFEPQLPYDQMKDILEDKENIEVTKDLQVTLEMKKETTIVVKLKNNGNFKQVIQKCAFLTRARDSQLSLIVPDNSEPITIKPDGEISYLLRCKAKVVGVSKELIIFKFKNFKVGRIVEIIVKSASPLIEFHDNLFNVRGIGQGSQSVIPQIFEDGMYIRGVKPYKPAKFIPIRPVTWKIPPILWSTIDNIIQEKKTHAESEIALKEKIPCLKQPLTYSNYKQRFNYLLYLEEIAMVLDMRRFRMESTVLHRSGEYLTLNVPGLAEKRPSLIIGDRVIVYFNWDKESKKHYEGYIHKIKSSDVYLKFNAVFHESYNEEECTVGFRASTTVLQRCHAAIGAVVYSLGSDFLFPQQIEEKEPQYNFIDPEEETENDELPKLSELNGGDECIKLIESIINKRKLKWFNQNLNTQQKEAVKNILKGLARPLPYVIFGPPGTGKTLTVVEAILQIYSTVTESRILIATPSNSSANLITDRLLDARILQPGNLVRLVAYHYLDSDMIPEQLLPFCVTADIAEEGTRAEVNQADPRGCQTQVTLGTLSQHRILIGTCSALGILYNMGCKPGHFTHLIVDEAGQASEPEIMIPLSLAHKNETQVVLAGDPKQLGPINQSRLAGYFGLNDSFLVRLLQQFPYQKDPEGFESGYDPRLITKLRINYRSLPDLLSLPNKLFYDSELIPQIDAESSEEAELLKRLADMLPRRLGAPPPVVFHCVYGSNMQDPDSPSWYNQDEIKQVYTYLVMLYNHGLQSDDIGIITPYAKQVFKIKSLLISLDVESPKIGSVEEFQGQERKVIILSTVRTSEDKVQSDIRHSLGFVAARERLNVAITRARSLLIIIGHPTLLQQDVYWRSVLEYCNSGSSIINRKFD